MAGEHIGIWHLEIGLAVELLQQVRFRRCMLLKI